jgi:hypothetical protein
MSMLNAQLHVRDEYYDDKIGFVHVLVKWLSYSHSQTLLDNEQCPWLI